MRTKTRRGDVTTCPDVRRRRAHTDLAVACLIVVTSFFVLRHFDLFAAVDTWSRAHEDLNVDEVVMATALAVVLSGVFGWRRYRDANAEADRLAAAERALAETNERYRSLYDLHPDAVFMLDSDGRLVSMNAAAVEMNTRR